MARTTVEVQIAKIRKQRELLEKKEKSLLARTQNKVLDKIVELARKGGISAGAITEALKGAGGSKAKTARKSAKKTVGKRAKVEPKFRNPDDFAQTWTGRGKMPLWVKALHEAGKLDSARIAPSA